MVQFGGQTAIKLAQALTDMGVPILGTSADGVDAAEDRERFDEILNQCGIPRAAGRTVFTTEQALAAAHEVGYPVLVRPSYVLGGQGMEIAYNDRNITEFMRIINQVEQEHPILVDKYLMGREVEVDGVFDGEELLIPGIMEHIERAGVHSGDSISVYPPIHIEDKHKQTILKYTYDLSKALGVVGLVNIQFVIYDDQVYVIEVNPRSSRTVPFLSKSTGVQMAHIATQVILGRSLREQGITEVYGREKERWYVKAPAFSFAKIRGMDSYLSPEMKSTGECLGIAKTFNEALYKAFEGAGIRLPKSKDDYDHPHSDQEEAVDIARRFAAVGYQIFATRGTARTLNKNGVKAYEIRKLEQESPNILDLVLGHQIDLIIDIPAQGAERSHDGFIIRRNAIETGVNVLTSLDTANALVTSLENRAKELTLIDIATVKNA